MEPKQVIVIRKDLGMRKGKMCAQAAHASMAVLLDACKHVKDDTIYLLESFKDDDPMYHWLNGPFVKIVVGCDSEEHLLLLHVQAFEKGIRSAIIQDAGRTEFHGKPTYTALAIGPDDPEKIDSITGHLKLL